MHIRPRRVAVAKFSSHANGPPNRRDTLSIIDAGSSSLGPTQRQRGRGAVACRQRWWGLALAQPPPCHRPRGPARDYLHYIYQGGGHPTRGLRPRTPRFRPGRHLVVTPEADEQGREALLGHRNRRGRGDPAHRELAQGPSELASVPVPKAARILTAPKNHGWVEKRRSGRALAKVAKDYDYEPSDLREL